MELPPERFWRAEDNDHWLRHIIESGATRVAAPRLKVKYIERKLEDVGDRPWQAEISGRLLSLAMDIREKADSESAKIAVSGIRFRAVAHIAVADARRIPGVDVFAEPNEDPAHANLVVLEVPLARSYDEAAAPKISHDLIKKLADSFLVVDEDQIDGLDRLRRADVA